MKTAYTHLNPSDARKLLEASADGSHKCRDPLDPTLEGCGAGLLDVDGAVAMAAGVTDLPGDPRLDNVVHGGYGCAVGDLAGGAPAGGGALALVLAAFLLVARAIKRA